MAAGHSDTFHHVRDFEYFELPFNTKLHLPEIPFLPSPEKILLSLLGELPPGEDIWGLQLTKFMVLQVVAAVLLFFIFRGLARRIGRGRAARGPWWNFWETLALYIRDVVVRPTIGTGHHDHGDHAHGESEQPVEHGHEAGVAHPADRYLPFIWSLFFYVLICNLLGAVPWMGSATGEINVTGALAVITMLAVIIVGSIRLGPVGFWLSLAPEMDLPLPMKLTLVPMIWVIELGGFLIKHFVLAVRLFANMMAGHTVIAVILGFIAVSADSWLYYVVLPSSILGQVAVGLLELLVAFIQAYIFAFLATLFIGMAVHPH